MKKTITISIIVLVSVIFLFFIFNKLFEIGKEPIRIGVIEELNIEKESRQEAFKGMELFIDEIKQRGLNGRKVELIKVESLPLDQEIALPLLEKFEEKYKPLAYISVGSDVPEFAAQFAEDNGAPYFTITSIRDFTEGREWVFQYGGSMQTYFGMVSLITNKLDTQNIGAMYNSDLFYGAMFPTITGDMFGRPNMKVEVQAYSSEDTDYREQIKALSHAEMIYITTKQLSQVQTILQQMLELDYQGGIMVGELFADPFSTEIPEFEGVYSSATLVHKSGFLFADELRSQFEEKYGTSVFSFFNEHAAQGYDVIRLIAGLLKEEDPTRKNLKNELDQGFNYDSIFGNIILEPGEHFIEVDFYPVRYDKGELEYLI